MKVCRPPHWSFITPRVSASRESAKFPRVILPPAFQRFPWGRSIKCSFLSNSETSFWTMLSFCRDDRDVQFLTGSGPDGRTTKDAVDTPDFSRDSRKILAVETRCSCSVSGYWRTRPMKQLRFVLGMRSVSSSTENPNAAQIVRIYLKYAWYSLSFPGFMNLRLKSKAQHGRRKNLQLYEDLKWNRKENVQHVSWKKNN